ncbi:interaptin [Periophthalmus magnuspinnatus]|uniref:interaptin n=1 Tax=Periophthalmus magnuspinnatus TaxID=409849 RepID=UPI002436E308|nr:interaptin [Periophthalmus magnuspinnatus]
MSKQNTQDGRKEIQKRTFTRWMNVYLSKRDPPAEVHDLFIDIQDGRILMTLLEELTGCTLLYRFRSSSHRIFRLNNISKALAFLDDRHVKLQGIDASAVADGVPSVVLNLIWNIILHFQVKEMTGGLRRRLSSSLFSLSAGSDLSELTDESIPNSGRNTAKSPKYNRKTIKSLLQWVQRCTVKFGVDVHDFGRSWRSGLAFLALIKSINPDLVDLRQSFNKDPEENLEQAFRTAHQSLDIPPLLEPQDMMCSYPDEKSIITYVSMFLRHCPDIVEDLSAAATSPHISQFRSLETLVDREDVQPVFTSFETSHELLLWKRWARRSSNSALQKKRKSSSALQPPSPLDANVVNPEIHSWLDKSVDRGYSKTKANEILFSLSSEEGIYSLTPLDSDEEDAYSYILDLNEDVSEIQAKRQVLRVEEENEKISPISDKEQDEFFTNSCNCESDVQVLIKDLNGKCKNMPANVDQRQTGTFENAELKKRAEKEPLKKQVEEISQQTTSLEFDNAIEFQPQSNQDWEGKNEEISANIENEEGTDNTQDVALIIEWLEKTQNEVGWAKKKPTEDQYNKSDGSENKLQTPNVSIAGNEYVDTKTASFIENLEEYLKEANNENECERFGHKDIVSEIGPGIDTKRHDAKGSVNVSKATDQNGDTSSRSNKTYQAASLSSEKRVLVQSVAPSSGISRVELHILLFLSMMLYCYFIVREITGY